MSWEREGSGFTALFEALALALCRDLPVLQAAVLLLSMSTDRGGLTPLIDQAT